jgi:endo-1,4-beta-xylanase
MESPLPLRHLPTRRDALRRALALAGLSMSPLGFADALAQTARRPDAIPYGAALRSGPLEQEADYRALAQRVCQIVVPEHELKWDWVRGDRAAFNLSAADRMVALAQQNRQAIRGHTLVWYAANPPWLDAITQRAEADRLLRDHVRTVVARYRRSVRSWDVVNEPIPNEPQSDEDLRASPWQKALGREHIEIAFRTARDTDPTADLVINEYDIEFEGPRYEARRRAFLNLLRRLKDRDVPVHTVGLQAHLPLGRKIDRDATTRLVQDIRALGLKIMVTELDIMDKAGPGDIEYRDMAVAATAFAFLEAVFAGGRPTAILTWGLTDRHTWVPMWWARTDGKPNRPLPFDADLKAKPLWRVIETFCNRPGT